MWTRSKVDLISLRCDAGAGGIKEDEVQSWVESKTRKREEAVKGEEEG